MTAAERGFLLLSSHLGDPNRKCLTVFQLRQLSQRVRSFTPEHDPREMEQRDLMRLGYGAAQAAEILVLLEQETLLDSYLRRCEQAGCGVLTRVSEAYPQALRTRLGQDAPGTLWYKGDLSALNDPKAALVGSRDIRPENAGFAHEAGKQAAMQGYALVSGNARGADRTAQDACLEFGGRVISVVPDALTDHTPAEGVLYLSEDGFDLPFSTPRALSRNRIIHALPHFTLVAQCAPNSGGTWDGTVRNLRKGWSKVLCFDDGSQSALLLSQMGAERISTAELGDFSRLAEPEYNLFHSL